MDAIDNLIYATLLSPTNSGPIDSDFLNVPAAFGTFAPVNTANAANVASPNWGFLTADKQLYCSFHDHTIIEQAITRHWYDINGQGLGFASNFVYEWPTLGGGANRVNDFTFSPGYHIIYSYLLENTRVLQIFERVIEKYFQDEDLGVIPQGMSNVYQWLINSERIFFKDEGSRSANIRSLLRPVYDANRRNAYNRMLGMDLAFGGINSGSGDSFPYFKAKASNQQFIALFERYLTEIWQGYINARNTSGANTTDVNQAVDLALQIQELMQARRGGSTNPGPGLTRDTYSNTNLSREEYSSAILLSWFTFIISSDTDVVRFLNCQSSTIGERLQKIGNKVGVPAHSKCQSLFEMAGAANQIMILLETGGSLDNPGWVQTMLSSLNPPLAPAVFIPTIQSDYMNNFLTLINNWEKTTGHKIKNPEANVRTVVSMSQPKLNGKPLATSLS
jgi:hypothetical protein